MLSLCERYLVGSYVIFVLIRGVRSGIFIGCDICFVIYLFIYFIRVLCFDISLLMSFRYCLVGFDWGCT